MLSYYRFHKVTFFCAAFIYMAGAAFWPTFRKWTLKIITKMAAFRVSLVTYSLR
jgi:hypothetical protein